MPEIGATLREARMRERIDVSEIEAQTKIRARYLRALENEEWDLLPGPTFIKSFLRTYATALGLDGKALVDEYRVHYEHPGEPELQPLSAPRRRSRAAGGENGLGGGGASRGYMVTVGLIAILIVVLLIGLLSGGSSPRKTTGSRTRSASSSTHRRSPGARAHGKATVAPGAPAGSLSLSLRANATVWVCLLGDSGRKLIPGVDVQEGESSGPFHAKRFLLTLGNASVALQVDGKPVSVPASTHAIGYEITAAKTTPLPPARQPTCA